MSAAFWPLVALVGLALAYRVAMAWLGRRAEASELEALQRSVTNLSDSVTLLEGRAETSEAWIQEQQRDASQKALNAAFVGSRR